MLMVAFPVLAVAGYFQIRLLAGRSQKNKKRMEQSGQTAVESIDNIRTVAGLGVEPRFYTKYYDLLKGPFRYVLSHDCVEPLSYSEILSLTGPT